MSKSQPYSSQGQRSHLVSGVDLTDCLLWLCEECSCPVWQPVEAPSSFGVRWGTVGCRKYNDQDSFINFSWGVLDVVFSWGGVFFLVVCFFCSCFCSGWFCLGVFLVSFWGCGERFSKMLSWQGSRRWFGGYPMVRVLFRFYCWVFLIVTRWISSFLGGFFFWVFENSQMRMRPVYYERTL